MLQRIQPCQQISQRTCVSHCFHSSLCLAPTAQTPTNMALLCPSLSPRGCRSRRRALSSATPSSWRPSGTSSPSSSRRRTATRAARGRHNVARGRQCHAHLLTSMKSAGSAVGAGPRFWVAMPVDLEPSNNGIVEAEPRSIIWVTTMRHSKLLGS